MEPNSDTKCYHSCSGVTPLTDKVLSRRLCDSDPKIQPYSVPSKNKIPSLPRKLNFPNSKSQLQTLPSPANLKSKTCTNLLHHSSFTDHFTNKACSPTRVKSASCGKQNISCILSDLDQLQKNTNQNKRPRVQKRLILDDSEMTSNNNNNNNNNDSNKNNTNTNDILDYNLSLRTSFSSPEFTQKLTENLFLQLINSDDDSFNIDSIANELGVPKQQIEDMMFVLEGVDVVTNNNNNNNNDNNDTTPNSYCWKSAIGLFNVNDKEPLIKECIDCVSEEARLDDLLNLSKDSIQQILATKNTHSNSPPENKKNQCNIYLTREDVNSCSLLKDQMIISVRTDNLQLKLPESEGFGLILSSEDGRPIESYSISDDGQLHSLLSQNQASNNFNSDFNGNYVTQELRGYYQEADPYNYPLSSGGCANNSNISYNYDENAKLHMSNFNNCFANSVPKHEYYPISDLFDYST